MNNDLQKSILKTLAWFDIFEYPLVAEELYKYLWQPNQKISYREFVEFLNQADFIERKDGFYFLPGSNKTVEKRQKKIKTIEHKIGIAKKATRKVRFVPFVKAVFVSNTVAAGTAGAHSDIDVFIVVKSGRLFLTRLLVTLLLTAFRLRRNKVCVANRVCLCFYSTDENINFEKIKIAGEDIYMAFWVNQLLPIYDPEKVGKNIIRKNKWIKKFLPNSLQGYQTIPKWKVEDNKISILFKKFFEKAWQGNYGDTLEKEAKKIQLTKMKMNLGSIQNEDNTKVIINDQMLKFHENDRREDYKKRWEEKCKKLIKI